ncbi:glycosyltransferase family 2 protein [Pseudomonas sp. TCU-HL1]|uniref:glycosyltransferase family 2 protein n=1 Tax=Pseudomonas sp. TCU-HL1 TaxID=1856685 RepID=UPI00083DFB1F|nr:glycosyltransferase family 2 protein [Pseudomonas sp. TCU-HL1]AOE84531.1 glycosyl transferase [Pseudomonas sp. TCU-HL1]
MKVSILMPAFNEEKFIDDAIKSIAKQIVDYEIELICVDDFSSDGTWVKLVALEKEYSFVRAFRNVEKGKCSAFNLAFEHSTGDYVMLLAGDDMLPEGALKARVEPLLDAGPYAITACKYRTTSTDSRLDGMVMPKLKGTGALSGGTIVFSREFALKVFPIPSCLVSEDMWIKCHIEYLDGMRVIDVPVVGLIYRLHENNSLRRDVGFAVKSEDIRRRSMVYSVFLESKRAALSQNCIEKLSRLAALETLRASGSRLSILLFKGVPLIDKLRALAYSHAVCYWLHSRLIRFSTGFAR